MAAVGSDDEFGFGPGAVEGPGAFHGADDVVAALHDHAGDVADARGVTQQVIVGFEKAFVEKIVDFDAGEGEGELVLFVVAAEIGVGKELGGCAFPSAPDFGGGELDGVVIAG